MPGREEFKQRATEVAWDTGVECPTCHGDGKIPGGPRTIHSMQGTVGCDISLESALTWIDTADAVAWSVRGWLGHHLELRKGRRTVWLDIAPEEVSDAR